jgi:SAM-dependent methyltransferase
MSAVTESLKDHADGRHPVMGRPATFQSFRDPAGAVFRSGARILRAVRTESVADLDAFLSTRAAREAMESGKLVRSVRLGPDECSEIRGVAPECAFYEHERVWFPSYPHEWPPELLYAAGRLTQDLFTAALPEGFGLKDATPYNILFQGASPVFVDVLSFERREPRDATWIAYAQFVRTFLLPLLAHREFGMLPADVFLRRRDGLEPEELYRWAGFGQRLSREFRSLVTLPHWLTRSMSRRRTSDIYHPKPLQSEEKARFVLDGLLDDCSRKLGHLEPRPASSTWTGYLDQKSLYTPSQLEQKERFVREALDLAKPRTALDVGANEGRFSFLAARQGASVVAIDTDAAVAGNVWREANAQNLDVLPLVVDLTRPTPALGWRNQECEAFLDRARGTFDLVMMLAVLHHMLVTERIPLEELLALAAELTRGYLLIEFVAPSDPMFVRIVRGREALHRGLTRAVFEAAAAVHFDLVKAQPLDGLDRCLYLYRLRPSNA